MLLQGLIDDALARGGDRVVLPNTGQDYFFDSLVIDAPENNRAGLILEMSANSVSGTRASRLVCTSLDKPAIHIKDGNLTLKHVRLTSTRERFNSPFEAPGIFLDASGIPATLTNPTLEDVWVNRQPGPGFVLSGVERGILTGCDSNSNRGVGYHIVQDGTVKGISNTFTSCRAYANQRGGWLIESWFNTFISCQSLSNNTHVTGTAYEIEVINSGQNNIFINFDVEAQPLFKAAQRPEKMIGYRISTKNNRIDGGIISGFDTGIWIGTTGYNTVINYPHINNPHGAITPVEDLWSNRV